MIRVIEFYASDTELEEKLNQIVGDGRLIHVEYIQDGRYKIIYEVPTEKTAPD